MTKFTHEEGNNLKVEGITCEAIIAGINQMINNFLTLQSNKKTQNNLKKEEIKIKIRKYKIMKKTK